MVRIQVQYMGDIFENNKLKLKIIINLMPFSIGKFFKLISQYDIIIHANITVSDYDITNVLKIFQVNAQSLTMVLLSYTSFYIIFIFKLF